MSTSQIVAAQSQTWFLGIPSWYVVPLFFSFVVYVITMVGETNRLPFDLAEGEGELGGGFHTEYSSMKFAMFFLGEYINMFTVAALATTLFLGGYHAPWPLSLIGDNMLSEGWWGLLWFTLKMWFFLWVFVWLRGSLPRVRYDQFMKLGWKLLIPLSLAWVIAVMMIRAAQEGYFGEGRWVTVVTLVIIGVFVLLGIFLWDRRAQMRQAEREEQMAVPPEVDPFADGYPVPPLPGQKLVEPRRAVGPAQPVPARTQPDQTDTDPEDSRG
jgi:NADH-quinone oxidoreductase subunit H